VKNRYLLIGEMSMEHNTISDELNQIRSNAIVLVLCGGRKNDLEAYFKMLWMSPGHVYKDVLARINVHNWPTLGRRRGATKVLDEGHVHL
jgi:hypothetical protein